MPPFPIAASLLCFLLAAGLPRPSAAAPEVELDRDGLSFDLADGGIDVTLGGSLFLDGAAYFGGRFADDDGTEIPRARATLTIDLFDAVKGEFQYDFADDDEPWQDVLVRYTGFERAELTVGQMEEPFGLENLTSATDLIFMERGLPDALAPGRTVGLEVALHGERWTAQAGLFGGNLNRDITDEGRAVGARATWSPPAGETTRLHLGLAGNLRWREDEAEFAIGPESAVTDRDLVDTGTIGDVARLYRLGVETAALLGPVTVLGEYMLALADRENGEDDAFLHGGTLVASWFVTGETRPYDGERGILDRVEPDRPVIEGGFGAVELAARVSFIDLNDGDVTGGRAMTYGLGINWYPDTLVKLMANLIRIEPLNGIEGGAGTALQGRIQIAF